MSLGLRLILLSAERMLIAALARCYVDVLCLGCDTVWCGSVPPCHIAENEFTSAMNNHVAFVCM